MTNWWRTPKVLFFLIDQAAGGFVVDAAADGSNHLCPYWYGPGGLVDDALAVTHWDSPAFCNPPYTRDILVWCEKFAEQARRGNTVIALLPAKTGTQWWAQGVVPYADIIFLTGRIPFERNCQSCGGDGKALDWGDDPNNATVITCPVCKGTCDDPTPSSPNFDSCLASYGPGTGGKVRWLDWKGTVKAIEEGDQILEAEEEEEGAD